MSHRTFAEHAALRWPGLVQTGSPTEIAALIEGMGEKAIGDMLCDYWGYLRMVARPEPVWLDDINLPVDDIEPPADDDRDYQLSLIHGEDI